MLQLNLIRENPDSVIERLAVKNFNGKDVVNQILSVDEKRRTTQTKLDTLLSSSNQLSKEIGELFKTGKKAEADALKEQTTAIKEESSKLKESLDEFEKQLQDLLVRLPNLPSKKVPAGRGAEQNEVVYSEGEKPALDKNA